MRLVAFLVLLGLVFAPASSAMRPAQTDQDRPRDADARFSRASVLATAGLLRSGATSRAGLIAGPRAEPGELRQAAVLELERLTGEPIVVRWDPVTGSPRLLFARNGWLSAPDGRPPETVAREFLSRHHDLLGLSAVEAASMPLTALVPATGGIVAHFRQEVAGIPVDHGHVAVALAQDGRVLSLSSANVGGGSLDPRPRMDPAAAAAAMAAVLGVEQSFARRTGELALGARVAIDGFGHSEVDVELSVFATAWGPRLAWKSRFDSGQGDAAWECVLDDSSGMVLRLLDLARHADTRGRVFLEDPDRSPHELLRFPDRTDFRSDAAPLGWADADQTVGNAVTAREDRDADNELNPGLLATASPGPPFLAFDFPYTGDPAVDLEAALTQLFYGVNFAHGHFLGLGFDEASGNFQQVNLGDAGLPGDPVLADAQDGAIANNAQFVPDRDGRSGRMQMGIWDVSGSSRDSCFDTGVVIHEFVHGVSTRLVGGPLDVGCLGFGQDGAMGEGWSDFFAASIFENPVIGAWISGNPDGIRMFRLDENPATGKDYRDYCTPPYQDALMQCGVHANGEIWSGFLWKVREAYIAAHGAEEGIVRVERLVVDGLKLTPCTPSMLDARDALILADRLATGGAHECLIKTEAAGRWMGFSAASDGPGDVDPAASDDAWPECTTEGVVRFTREGLEPGQALAVYGCEDLVGVSVTDGNAVGPVQVIVSTSGGDSEIVDLTAAFDPAVFLGSLVAEAAAVVPGDGILQVAPGEMLTVDYEEQDPPRLVSSSALIDCAARLEIVRHRIVESTCDDDAVPGFPGLPGFLDAGESADIVLELGNLMPTRVQGAVRVTTDRPDLLTILPALTPLPIDLPAATGEAFPGIDTVTVRVVAADDFLGTPALDLEVSLIADGYDALVSYPLTLRLDLDYQLETGLIVADGAEAETGGPVGPAWTTDVLVPGGGNRWTLVGCHASEGTRSYRNGPDSCTGTYVDNQGVPWLSAPTLDFSAAGAEAARITNLSFQHDVQLYGGVGQFAIFGADGVALLVTNDPSALDISQPLSLLLDAAAAYANLPDFGIDSNTSGFVPQSIDLPPEALPGVDQLQPIHVTWLFYPDFFSPGFGATVAAGYYVDELVVTYDRVIAVPSAAACTAEVTPFAFPLVLEPLSGVACAGEAVHVDASRSEAALCDPPQLESRFLVDGVPVLCATDAGGMTARVQDPEGWGTDPSCWDVPLGDTQYDVEVRCQASPTPTDLRSVSVRLLDGTPVVVADPAGFCVASPEPVVLDASGSALVGCPGSAVYRFLDAMGAELDCDGDGNPDGFRTEATCELPASAVDLEVRVELGCEDLPGCALSEIVLVPALDLFAVAEEVAGPGTVHCPDLPIDLTAASSTATGCAGMLEYRWTSPSGLDTGWSTDPLASVVLEADENVLLELRCDAFPDCRSSVELPVDLRGGQVELSSDAAALDCPDTAFILSAAETEPVQCDSGFLEYRFEWDEDGDGTFEPLDCDGDGAPDDFAATDICSTTQVEGGASYLVRVRCTEDLGCELASLILAVSPWDGVPTGEPQGTLMVGRDGNCPDGPIDVLLDWSDSGRVPAAFVLLRSEAADTGFAEMADVDGTVATDAGLTCSDPARTLYRGADVLFYLIRDRNVCTGDPIGL